MFGFVDGDGLVSGAEEAKGKEKRQHGRKRDLLICLVRYFSVLAIFRTGQTDLPYSRLYRWFQLRAATGLVWHPTQFAGRFMGT